MLNFDFKRSGRKCSQTERALLPGEEFFSALIELDNGTVERRDFAAEVWDSPPEGTIGWWKSSIPELGKGRVYWAPRNVLLAYFDHVSKQPELADITYITALLLIQKKYLSNVDSFEEEDTEFMELANRQSNEKYRIPVMNVTQARLVEIQQELGEQLFVDSKDATEGQVD